MIPRGCQDGMDAIGNCLEQMLEEFPCGFTIRFVHKLGDGELTRPVDADDEEELALDRLNLGDVYVE